ncbi:hypothetical protein THF1D04_30386 [Vibrio owensii]|uniref:Sulfatase N-terminal domain-containing protein n=1 Tax=Vibrio owensii TaxID=696485 RepID=A0AAU9Q6Y6_9VIBR|nr:hypothetical protein THF1D04_30386 [Vibrio owensii]
MKPHILLLSLDSLSMFNGFLDDKDEHSQTFALCSSLLNKYKERYYSDIYMHYENTVRFI